MPPPVQVPVIDKGAPLVNVKMPESCQWLTIRAHNLGSAVQIVTGAEGQLVYKGGLRHVRDDRWFPALFEEILVRIAYARQIVQFLAEGVIHHGASNHATNRWLSDTWSEL